MTLSDKLAEAKGHPAGFDYMRLILALSVIAAHTNLICGGAKVPSPLVRGVETLTFLIVPMFFALSGFLVAGSLERSKTLVSFLGLRVFRIIPALLVEVFVSALIIGTLFTTYSLHDYVRDHRFATYFINILGEPHYYLPGVFDNNPFQKVNGQIWTIPFELICYALLSLIAVLPVYRNKKYLLIFLVVCYLAQGANTIFRPNLTFSGPTGTTAVISFLFGIAMYRFRESVEFSTSLFLASLGFVVVLLLVPNGVRFFALPVSYLTVYLGLLDAPRSKILLGGDYSYGIYLYGFPIQQALIATSDLFKIKIINFLVASFITILLACASWWLIERPILTHKRILKPLDARFLRLCTRFPPFGIIKLRAQAAPIG